MNAQNIFGEIESLSRQFFSRFKLNNNFGEFDVNLDGIRKSFLQAARALEKDIPELEYIRSETLELDGRTLNMRMYYPKVKDYAARPALVFFHGGGFVLGDLDSHDIICHRLAAASGTVIISVEYRKAPTHTFPSAHDDAYEAWVEICKKAQLFGIQPHNIGIGGDSAGANLAVYVTREAILQGARRPAALVLYYPLLQFVDIRSTPMSLKQSGLFLSPALFEYFRDSYIPNQNHWMDPRVSPLFADTNSFTNFPPIHIVMSEWDPLTVEASVFIDKLTRCGVTVSKAYYKSTMHGFLNLTAFVATARTALLQSGEALNSMMKKSDGIE